MTEPGCRPKKRYLAEFPDDEYAARYSKARTLMAQEGVDALLINGGENLFYYSGFKKVLPNLSKVRTYAMHFLILPRDAEPILILPMQMRGNAEYMSWVKDVRFFNFGFYPMPNVDPFDVIRKALDDLRLTNKTLGLEIGEMDIIDWSQRDFDTMKNKMLSSAKIVDGSGIMWKMRNVKSKGEQDALKQSCKMSAKAMESAFEYARPGMTEREISRQFYRSLIDQGIEDSLLRAFLAIRAGPCRYGMSDSRPSNTKLEKGDILVLDGGTQYKGYNCDFTRLACVGEPSSKQHLMFEAARKSEEEALAAIREGVKMGEVVNAAEKVIDQFDLRSVYPYTYVGHNIGLIVHEPPFLTKGSEVVLQEGNALAIEPIIYDSVAWRYVSTGEGHLGAEGIFFIEDNVIVTNSGYENNTDIDRELRIIK